MPKKSTTKRRRPATGSKPRSQSRSKARPKPSPKASSRKSTTRKRTSGGSVTVIATEKFVSDLIIRGDAQHPSPEGKLEGNATHVIVERQSGGRTKVKRARFKLY